MIFNSQTYMQKQISRMSSIRKMTLFENRWKGEMYKILQSIYVKVAGSIENGDPTPEDMVDYFINDLTKNETKWLYKIIPSFAEDVWKSLGIKKSSRDYSTKGFVEDAFYRWMYVWAQTRAAVMVSQVTNTTKNIIRRILKKGMIDQIPNNILAKNLIKTGLIANKKRAQTIVKTETHTAAMGGIHNAMESTNIPMNKEWSYSRGGGRTRRWHQISQIVPMKEPFIVFGESLDYPGDPVGSAKNIVNCRCVALYHTAV